MSKANERHATNARMALEYLAENRGYESYKEFKEDYIISDLLADIMHLCDKENLDFDFLVERARDHHTCEVNPDDIEQGYLDSLES